MITAIHVEYSYTVGYNSRGDTGGASVGLAFHPALECPSNHDPAAQRLYTSPPRLQPKYDITHEYSKPVAVSLHGLSLDVSRPGSRLALHFTNSNHNMQVLLPIELHLQWDRSGEHTH